MEGGRRRRSHKKLRLVKKKTVRRMLAKQGLRMRGGGHDAQPSVPAGGVAETAAHVGGKRHRRKSHSRKRRGFTMKKLFKF